MASLIVAGLQSSGIQIVHGDDTIQKFDLDSLHKQLLVWHTDKGSDVSANYLPNQNQIVEGTWNFQLNIKMLTGKTFHIAADRNTTVLQVKEMIRSSGDIPPEQQKLIYSGKELKDGRTLIEHNIQTDSTVHMIIRGGGTYCLDEKVMLDPRYDYTYPMREEPGEQYKRGGINFQRPYGFIKKALKVLGRYDNDTWLGVTASNMRTNSVSGEWPVSYHGTKKEFAESIGINGYELSKGKRFLYGRGIYTTPTPSIAERYATSFTCEGNTYIMIIMNRVDMDSTRVVRVADVGVYYITSEENDVRPYAFLFKKI